MDLYQSFEKHHLWEIKQEVKGSKMYMQIYCNIWNLLLPPELLKLQAMRKRKKETNKPSKKNRVCFKKWGWNKLNSPLQSVCYNLVITSVARQFEIRDAEKCFFREEETHELTCTADTRQEQISPWPQDLKPSMIRRNKSSVGSGNHGKVVCKWPHRCVSCVSNRTDV